MIQKNVHQIWLGNRKLPPKKIMQSWINYCEKFGWKYHLWTESEIDKINLKNNYIYQHYKSRNDFHGMSDVARIEIVNQFGGLYCDVDFFSWQTDIEKFTPLNHDMFIGCTENDYPKRSRLHMEFNDFPGRTNCAFHLANGFFIAPKDNNILSFMLEQMQYSFSNNQKYSDDFFVDCEGNERKFGAADIVGCFLLTHCAKKHPFVLISPKFMFTEIKYVTERGHRDFKKDIICSYIYNHDEKIVEGLS
jgi:hypothetical protein